MTELDGVWKVERRWGLLPPMVGVVKRIHGTRGETRVADTAGAPFDVRGLELHYRAPLSAFVDVLEPDGEGFSGRATVLGREFGTFALRRVDMADELNAQLIKHIDEAHAMEQNVLRMLDGMIATTDDPEIIDQLEFHKMQTQGHADRMKQRLAAREVDRHLHQRAARRPAGTPATATRPSTWRSRATSC